MKQSNVITSLQAYFIASKNNNEAALKSMMLWGRCELVRQQIDARLSGHREKDCECKVIRLK